MYTIGLDISTSVTGVAIFNEEYKLMDLSYIKFNKKNTLFQKLDEFVEFMKQYDELDIKYISIEEPLKAFKGKFSNADTIQKLTTMNALISGFLYRKHKIEPKYFNASSARKTAFPDLKIPQSSPNKKYLIWNAVMTAEPQINWVYSKRTHKLINENFDMADAYTVGVASITHRIKEEKAIKKVEKLSEATK